MKRTVRTTSVVAMSLLALAALAGCSQADREAEVATSAPESTLATASASDSPSVMPSLPPPAEPGSVLAGAPTDEETGRVGFGRGTDLCVFNKREEPISVTFDERTDTQGSSPVAAGGWYCGYDTPDFFGFSGVRGWISDIPNESNKIRISGINNPSYTSVSLEVRTGKKNVYGEILQCEAGGFVDEGQTFDPIDTGNARFVLSRSNDDWGWKYLAITVEPSQGITDNCVLVAESQE